MSDPEPGPGPEPAPGPEPVAPVGPGLAHLVVADLDLPVADAADRHHLERVLRLRRGDPVTLTDGRGRWRSARWGEPIEPEGPVVRAPAPPPEVTVGFALVKGDRPEWIVQKLTEAGVDRIVPVAAARCVVRWEGERGARQVERLRRVAREAVMQCRRATLPVVEDVVELRSWAAGRAGSVTGGVLSPPVLADPAGAPPSLDRPSVVVGPEGGFDPDELALVPGRVRLGAHVLRTETAAVAAGVLLAALREHLTVTP